MLALVVAVRIARTIELPVSFWTYVGGFVVPVLTALVTTRLASAQLKALCNAVLAVVAGTVAVAVTHSGQVVVGDFVVGVFQALVAAWAVYHGFYKPTGVTDAVNVKTANAGLGPKGYVGPSQDLRP